MYQTYVLEARCAPVQQQTLLSEISINYKCVHLNSKLHWELKN